MTTIRNEKEIIAIKTKKDLIVQKNPAEKKCLERVGVVQ